MSRERGYNLIRDQDNLTPSEYRKPKAARRAIDRPVARMRRRLFKHHCKF